MDLDLATVRLFMRVAALRAIGRAGQEQGYSAATTTQRLQALEAELGVSLLSRTTRSVTLTQDGERFLAHARSILGAVEDARLDLSGGETRIKGMLRVTASATFGRQYIAPHIPQFLQQHPDAHIDLQLTDSVLDIVEHGFDLSVRVGTLASSTLRARKLADNPRALVAAPAYIERHGAPASPVDLASHDCILLGDEQSWGFETAQGKTERVSVSGRFQCNHGEAILRAACSGVGIAVKSLWDAGDAIARGDLVVLMSDFRVWPEWNIWAVRPPSPLVPARTRVFTEFLQEKFRTLPAYQHIDAQ